MPNPPPPHAQPRPRTTLVRPAPAPENSQHEQNTPAQPQTTPFKQHTGVASKKKMSPLGTVVKGNTQRVHCNDLTAGPLLLFKKNISHRKEGSDTLVDGGFGCKCVHRLRGHHLLFCGIAQRNKPLARLRERSIPAAAVSPAPNCSSNVPS